MRIQKSFPALLLAVAAFTACKKDVDPVIIVPPSSGVDKVTFDGGTGGSAANSVYLDFSADKATSSPRAGWDLGFYSGADFRVILNNTTSAGAKVTGKYSLADVGATDTSGLTLAVNLATPAASDYAYFDDIAGDITKTVIPAVSATDVQNPVIILNRGVGGGIAARPWVKLRVLRNGSTGYTVQYAGITETTFKTMNVTKDAAYNFTYASLDNGTTLTVEPEKTKWDLTWGCSVYQTNFGAGLVPYSFSDLIAVNNVAGVQAAEKVYADATAANAAYTTFNKDSVNRTTLATGRWSIGSNWRTTPQPGTTAGGARQDRFYLVKDANGNYYKLKCLSMGAGNDGGTRGKPEFKYTLISMQ